MGGSRCWSARAPDGAQGTAEGTIRPTAWPAGRAGLDIRHPHVSTGHGGPPAWQAGLTEAVVEGLTVDGQAVAVGPGSRVEVAGSAPWSSSRRLRRRRGAAGQRPEGRGHRPAGRLGDRTAVRDRPSRPVRGRGRPEEPAPVAPREPAARRPSRRPAPRPRTPSRRRHRTERAPLDRAAPRRPGALGLPRRALPEVALPDGQGYVFPVFGDASFADDYGAPRASRAGTTGTTSSRPPGTPVLAVADGTLSRVGINNLGGNRLWLTDGIGNEFYYAHLSAYAPASRVRRPGARRPGDRLRREHRAGDHHAARTCTSRCTRRVATA